MDSQSNFVNNIDKILRDYRVSVRAELKAEINYHSEQFLAENPKLPATALLQHLRIVVL